MIYIDTPVGTLVMDVAEDGAVTYASFEKLQADAGNNTSENHSYAKLVHAYFDGDLTALDAIPRRQEVGPFLTDIYRAMSEIPAGQTLSYAKLAAAAGHPLAVRAAGTACARNQLPLLVPCHRVIRSDGSLGNYGYGTNIKQWLLDHEAGRLK